jgi:hypothetical protein
LRRLTVGCSKQPFFEKSAINETSFEWTGVDKNRQNHHHWCFISHKTPNKTPVNTIYRLFGGDNLATSACNFLRLLLIFDIQSLNLKLN